jgi:hypothetical protein
MISQSVSPGDFILDISSLPPGVFLVRFDGRIGFLVKS